MHKLLRYATILVDIRNGWDYDVTVENHRHITPCRPGTARVRNAGTDHPGVSVFLWQNIGGSQLAPSETIYEGMGYTMPPTEMLSSSSRGMISSKISPLSQTVTP